MIPTTEYVNTKKLVYATDTILTEMFIQALENEIEKEYDSISSFFRYLDSNLRCNYKLKDTIRVLEEYLVNNNQNYPDSLSKAGLDITNLYSIVRNCDLEGISEADFGRFDHIRNIRNFCYHSTEMTKKDFEINHKAIESIIDKWSYIKDEMKLRYKQRMDFILKKDDVHQMFYEFYHKLATQDVNYRCNELDRKKNDDTKRIDELIKKVAQLEFNLEVKKVEKDDQEFNAINQKLEKFEVKLDELYRNQKETVYEIKRNTTEIKKIKNVITSLEINFTVVRYQDHDYRVNMKFLIKLIFI
jgi:hypothetical protein